MNGEFTLLNKIKWLQLYAEKYIFVSFPKMELALKIRMETYLYALIENVIKANINKGNVRKKYQLELLSDVFLIDYFIGIIYEKKIITKKRFESFITALNEIKKMVYKWMQNETI